MHLYIATLYTSTDVKHVNIWGRNYEEAFDRAVALRNSDYPCYGIESVLAR